MVAFFILVLAWSLSQRQVPVVSRVFYRQLTVAIHIYKMQDESFMVATFGGYTHMLDFGFNILFLIPNNNIITLTLTTVSEFCAVEGTLIVYSHFVRR